MKNQATVTVLIFTLVYILCNIPVLVSLTRFSIQKASEWTIDIFGEPGVFVNYYIWPLTYITLVQTNSLLNPMIYLVRMSWFRARVVGVFGRAPVGTIKLGPSEHSESRFGAVSAMGPRINTRSAMRDCQIVENPAAEAEESAGPSTAPPTPRRVGNGRELGTEKRDVAVSVPGTAPTSENNSCEVGAKEFIAEDSVVEDTEIIEVVGADVLSEEGRQVSGSVESVNVIANSNIESVNVIANSNIESTSVIANSKVESDGCKDMPEVLVASSKL